MFDQQNGDAETVADRVDAVQQILGFRRIHACRRLVKQQQFHAGRQRSCDFQLTLRSIRQIRGFGFGQSFQSENTQQVYGFGMHVAFLLPEGRRAEDRTAQPVGEGFVERHKHVLFDRHLIEQSNVLEGSCDSRTHDLIRFLAVHAFAVEEELTFRGLVNAGQQVEHSGLACAVRPDQTDKFARIDGHVEVGYGFEASEGDAEMLGLQNRLAHACTSLSSLDVLISLDAVVSPVSLVFLDAD